MDFVFYRGVEIVDLPVAGTGGPRCPLLQHLQRVTKARPPQTLYLLSQLNWSHSPTCKKVFHLWVRWQFRHFLRYAMQVVVTVGGKSN